MTWDVDDVRAQHIKKAIELRAFVRKEEADIFAPYAGLNGIPWLFDLRNILLEPDFLEDIAVLFWRGRGKKEIFSIGGVETAAIPLVTSLIIHGKRLGYDCSGFFVRKARKKEGLMRAIEGTIRSNSSIILVDDLINSGKSLIRQVEILETAGHRVVAVWTLIRFRDMSTYEYFRNKNIIVESLFELDDFSKTLGVENVVKKKELPHVHPYRIEWKFAAAHPSYFHVVPKSTPTIDENKIYVGSDNGTMWALDQKSGEVCWSFAASSTRSGKGIFSSPTIWRDFLYFGGYDGNVYALDAATGARRWISYEADWIGSSPALSPDLGLLFIGLEFGLWRKRGGIAAFDLETGLKRWSFVGMPAFTHSSPLYIRETQQVVIGSNDGAVYAFKANSGELLWKFQTGIPTKEELNAGFSRFDVKGSPAYDAKRNRVIITNLDGGVFFLDCASGKLEGRFNMGLGSFATPVVENDSVLVSSLDKNLYCINAETFKEQWRWHAHARIFATPLVVEKSVYIGSNAGRLAELDLASGNERSFLSLTERITNRIVYNPLSRVFFVPTYANEVYCVRKLPEETSG